MARQDPKPSPLARAGALTRWLSIGAVLLGIWLALNYTTLREFFEARHLRNDNRRQVSQLEQKYFQLVQEKRDLEQFGFPAEKAIRERFKMIRPGEKLMIIETPDSSADKPAELKPWPEN